jgi:phage antirepressor YoqD-like protein
MKKISTSALAKIHGTAAKELFNQFTEQGFIVRDGESWALTKAGESNGGEYQESAKFGKYIVWPESIQIESQGEVDSTQTSQSLITAKNLASHFDISANKINFILSELGWLKKGIKGWIATEQGLKNGGIQTEDRKSGIPFVRWPDSILQIKSLRESIDQVKGKSSESEPVVESPQDKNEIGFREKFEAKHRSADGHFVRSKAEMLIDNWLYMAEIVHAYERKLPIEEDVYCDFYIPTGKVYIEYWGYENDQKYLARKKQKIEIYKKYGFNLIELQDEEVQNLDDILPRMLLKFGVQSY